MSPFPIIEKLSLVAPLGLCFHDAATGERVIDRLSVRIEPVSEYRWKKIYEARPNPSGVYVFHQAAGLEEFTRGAGDAEFWQAHPPQKEFIVEVSDLDARFLPFRFSLKLPVKGIYQWEAAPAASPNKSLSSIPLYSAPARKTLGGMAVIRAELRESAEKAAAFAVLEARLGAALTARGIADRQGRIVLMFPVPAPEGNPLSSPPSSASRVALDKQQWNLDLTLKYEPAVFNSSPPVAIDADSEILPDLRQALDQSPGSMWADVAKTEILNSAVLCYGRELTLRSREAIVESPPMAKTPVSSYLYVSPA